MAVEDVDSCGEAGIAGIAFGYGLDSDRMDVQTRQWNGRDVCIEGNHNNQLVCFSNVVCASKSDGPQASGSIQASGGGNGTKDNNASGGASATVTVPVGSGATVSVTGGASGSTSTKGGNTTGGGNTTVKGTVNIPF